MLTFNDIYGLSMCNDMLCLYRHLISMRYTELFGGKVQGISDSNLLELGVIHISCLQRFSVSSFSGASCTFK